MSGLFNMEETEIYRSEVMSQRLKQTMSFPAETGDLSSGSKFFTFCSVKSYPWY